MTSEKVTEAGDADNANESIFGIGNADAERAYLDKWTPGGSQTRSKRRLFPNPATIVGGEGARVWDSERRQYIDWISGLCAVGLGHQHPAVDEAVRAQLRRGTCMPLPTKLEAETAAELCSAIKFGEQVRWVSTGSEATVGAMMIARRATGRRTVISIGYHGWTSGHLAGAGVIVVPWGDLAKLESTLRGNYVAAVLMEPMRDTSPPAGYLEQAIAATHRAGALFIMDEIVTGFRWRVGGATEFFGLNPDLACFGKAMANGYRCAAIVGRREIMNDYADGVSSTYGGECVGLAAARATIRVYQTEKVVERLWETGKLLMARMDSIQRPMIGYPVHPRFKSEETVGDTWLHTPQDVRELTHRMAAKGVLAHPAGLNPMLSHSAQDIEQTVEAAT